MANVNLPVPVLDQPHWRLNFRPATYDKTRLDSLKDCLETVQKHQVRKRGWSFPHIPRDQHSMMYGENFLAAWSDAWGHLEYWRLYQSSQFLYLGSVREVTEKEWSARIRHIMKSHADDHVDIDSVPGFLSITEVIFTVTEYFEFAARLAQAEIYKDVIQVSISITGIAGFMLAADQNRIWSSDYVTSQDRLTYDVRVGAADVVASGADEALKCAIWIFERFGWLTPSIDAIKLDQQKLLTGRF
jgi:hypothetical protein